MIRTILLKKILVEFEFQKRTSMELSKFEFGALNS